jgi:hypothetical protein
MVQLVQEYCTCAQATYELDHYWTGLPRIIPQLALARRRRPQDGSKADRWTDEVHGRRAHQRPRRSPPATVAEHWKTGSLVRIRVLNRAFRVAGQDSEPSANCRWRIEFACLHAAKFIDQGQPARSKRPKSCRSLIHKPSRAVISGFARNAGA